MSLPEDDEIVWIDPDTGKEYFDEEQALAKLLTDNVLFANSRRYWSPAFVADENGNFKDSGGGHLEAETIVLFVNCNDLFYWACSDAEEIPYSEIKTLFKMHIEDPVWGSSKWCCRRRGLRPQVPIVRDMKAQGKWTEELEALPPPGKS